MPLKNSATGVPWCGVETVTTARIARAHRSASAAVGSDTSGDVTSRASSPPLEWPTMLTTPPRACSSSETFSTRSAARRRREAVGSVCTTRTSPRTPSAGPKSASRSRTCPK
jgi:hypothetical protein